MLIITASISSPYITANPEAPLICRQEPLHGSRFPFTSDACDENIIVLEKHVFFSKSQPRKFYIACPHLGVLLSEVLLPGK